MKWDEWKGDLNGRPVMWVKHLFEWWGWRVSIHKFVDADAPGCYHSHPATAYRFVLWGWYKEVIVESFEEGWTITDIVTWKRWRGGKVEPDLVHNIFDCSKPCYTLWIRGPKTHKVKLIGSGWHENG